VRRAATALALVLALAGPAAAAACPRTSVTDVEDEVMCPVCGTSLGTSGDAPLAAQERRLIGRLVAQCRTKDQIKDALVAEYGEEVLAVPKAEGFGLATYLVPGLAFLAALAGVVLAALRWRRSRPAREAAAAGAGAAPGAGPPAAALPAADAARLQADLDRYDL
jgi:cytochrome c-type biogenesis protein CcmH/NrfF